MNSLDLVVDSEVAHLLDPSSGGAGVPPTFKEARDRAVSRFEKAYVSMLLRMTAGNMAMAARIAGLDRSNFRKMVVRSGVDFREFIPRQRGGGMAASAT